MRLLERAFDGVELALSGAHGAAHTLARIDISLFASLKLSFHRAGRAGIGTGHATDTLLIINLGNAVLHLDCAEVTGLHACLATDAGTIAFFLQSDALFRIVTANIHHAASRTHGKHMLRASRNALFTGLTLFLIDDGNLLDRVNVDRVKRTCALTGAQAQTSILTGLRAVVDQRSCNTVGHALIVSLRLAVITIALAGHGRHHTDGSTDRNAHDFAHFCRTRRTAHGAGADLGLAIGNGGSITVTTGEAAGAAVCPRQTLAQRLCLFIDWHLEHATGDAQQRAKEQAQNAHHKRGD